MLSVTIEVSHLCMPTYIVLFILHISVYVLQEILASPCNNA